MIYKTVFKGNVPVTAPSKKSRVVEPVGGVPRFKDAPQFIAKKIKMLEKDFKIHLTQKQLEHLWSLESEGDINIACRSIIDQAWR